MNLASPSDYLETEVMTAAPQKLQLMLIEAAIRQTNAVREHWKTDNQERASEALIRAQQIITEMLCSLNPEKDKDLTSKVAAVYMFVFRSLQAAQATRSDEKLVEAISVLEVERETWQKVCLELGATQAAPAPHMSGSPITSSSTSFEA